jgi:hypothetical protein
VLVPTSKSSSQFAFSGAWHSIVCSSSGWLGQREQRLLSLRDLYLRALIFWPSPQETEQADHGLHSVTAHIASWGPFFFGGLQTEKKCSTYTQLQLHFNQERMELKIIQDSNFYVDLPVYMSLRTEIAAVVLSISDFYSPSILQSWTSSMNRGEEECM